jgi:hypothetical protein
VVAKQLASRASSCGPGGKGHEPGPRTGHADAAGLHPARLHRPPTATVASWCRAVVVPRRAAPSGPEPLAGTGCEARRRRGHLTSPRLASPRLTCGMRRCHSAAARMRL